MMFKTFEEVIDKKSEGTLKGTQINLKPRCFLVLTVVLFLIISLFPGCAGRREYSSRPKAVEKPLARLGYTIQVGAFSDVQNAARLTGQLQARGVDATYFVARTGL
ncbi:MAG: SPOR domain-containing protein, partial [Syntrophales bacterium]